jgi:hypothetical protein
MNDQTQTTAQAPTDLDDYIRFRIPSGLKKELQFLVLRDDEDMSDVLRRLIQQYVDERRPL